MKFISSYVLLFHNLQNLFSRILNYFEIYQFFRHKIKCEVHRGQHQWNVYTVIYSFLLKAIF